MVIVKEKEVKLSDAFLSRDSKGLADSNTIFEESLLEGNKGVKKLLVNIFGGFNFFVNIL